MENNIDDLLKVYWSSRTDFFQKELDELLDSEQASLWLAHIVSYISNKQARILDAGCANGFIAFLLHSAGFNNITGMDYCEDMILKAKENAVQRGSNIEFMEGNLETTGFPDDHFDVIVCRNVLWQLSNPHIVLNEVYRILKAEGVFIYFDANRSELLKDNPSEKLSALAKMLPSLQSERPQWDLSLLNESGFKSVDVNNNIQDLKDASPYSDLQVFKVVCRKQLFS